MSLQVFLKWEGCSSWLDPLVTPRQVGSVCWNESVCVCVSCASGHTCKWACSVVVFIASGQWFVCSVVHGCKWAKGMLFDCLISPLVHGPLTTSGFCNVLSDVFCTCQWFIWFQFLEGSVNFKRPLDVINTLSFHGECPLFPAVIKNLSESAS